MPGHRAVMRDRLLLEPLFLAPGRQLHLGVGLVGRACPAVEVFFDDRLMRRVVLDLLADDVGPVPFAVIGHQPHQPPRQRIGRFVQDRQREMLEPLGRQAVGLAPESQPDMGVGVFAGLGRRLADRQPRSGSGGADAASSEKAPRLAARIRARNMEVSSRRKLGRTPFVLVSILIRVRHGWRLLLRADFSKSGTASNGLGVGLTRLLSWARTPDCPTKKLSPSATWRLNTGWTLLFLDRLHDGETSQGT